MKALLTRTSDWENRDTIITINTLEELKELIEREHHPVVVNIPFCDNKRFDLTIEIYDDWRE